VEQPEGLVWPYSDTHRVRPAHLAQRSPAPAAQRPILYPSLSEACKLLSDSFCFKFVAPTLRVEDGHAEDDVRVADTPTVTFLGTGCSVPSKYRNVSAFYFTTTRGEVILCDAGEGTLGQWSMFAGPALASVIARLVVVFISHSHADHHLGLRAILEFRRWILPDPSQRPVLHLIAPADVVRVVGNESAYDGCNLMSDDSIDLHVLPSRDEPNRPAAPSSLVDRTELTFGDCALSLVYFPVDHPANAYGVVMRSRGESAWLYSGDTRPSAHLVNIARQYAPVSILIHEATFDDDLVDDARCKKHSTITEAMTVGRDSRAAITLLTHFSQRYPKLPPLGGNTVTESTGSPSSTAEPPVTQFAFDMMVVPLANCNLGHTRRMLQDSSEAFSALLNEYDGWTEGTSKRLRGSS